MALAVLLAGFSVQVGPQQSDCGSDLGLGRQLVAEEEDRCADDDHPLDHIADSMGHRAHPLQRVEGELHHKSPQSVT